MGKAHEPNVQRNEVHDKREVGELTPDGGESPRRQREIEADTNREPASMSHPQAPRIFPRGSDVSPDVHERPGDDKSSVATTKRDDAPPKPKQAMHRAKR